MTVIGIRYLTGYAAAMDLSSGGPEWPPHPGRVFMAMAAAHFETGEAPEERRALEWLECQGAPWLRASAGHPRSAYETYVPVNDDHGGIANRSRQSRAFPKFRPDGDLVLLGWATDAPEEIGEALSGLCRKVARIGHSASLVQMWLANAAGPQAGDWVPEEGAGEVRLRVPVAGTLRYLEECFGKVTIQEYDRLEAQIALAKGSGKAKAKRELKERFPNGRPEAERPQLTVWQGYQRREEVVEGSGRAQGPFDADFLVLGAEGRALGLESTLALTAALRNAVMNAAGSELPEWLTGHTQERAPARSVHVAFFPLAYVGREHADGHVMGLGIAIPRHLTETAEGRRELRERLGPLFFEANGTEKELAIWRKGVWNWKLQREDRERPPETLQQRRWTGPSRCWASVTPVVLHHYPKRRDGEVERIVTEAFVSAGFPEPEQLEIGPVSAHRGAGHIREMPEYDEGGETMCRYQVHVTAWFGQCIEGPMLVGRGRYRGYGLFAPYAGGLR